MKRSITPFLSLVLVLVCLPAVGESRSEGKDGLRVMSYNLDEGTDFLEVQQASGLQQFLIAVGQTITQVRATNPRERMEAVAKQIIAARPTLVSLQEVDQWSSSSFDPVARTCGPIALEFDMMQELLDASPPKARITRWLCAPSSMHFRRHPD